MGAAGIDGFTTSTAIRIIGVPRLSARREPCPLFAMDAEYAEFAASALRKGDYRCRGSKKVTRKKFSDLLFFHLISNSALESLKYRYRFLFKVFLKTNPNFYSDHAESFVTFFVGQQLQKAASGHPQAEAAGAAAAAAAGDTN